MVNLSQMEYKLIQSELFLKKIDGVSNVFFIHDFYRELMKEYEGDPFFLQYLFDNYIYFMAVKNPDEQPICGSRIVELSGGLIDGLEGSRWFLCPCFLIYNENDKGHSSSIYVFKDSDHKDYKNILINLTEDPDQVRFILARDKQYWEVMDKEMQEEVQNFFHNENNTKNSS